MNYFLNAIQSELYVVAQWVMLLPKPNHDKSVWIMESWSCYFEEKNLIHCSWTRVLNMQIIESAAHINTIKAPSPASVWGFGVLLEESSSGEWHLLLCGKALISHLSVIGDYRMRPVLQGMNKQPTWSFWLEDLLHGMHGGVVVSTVASEQEGSWFVCSSCVHEFSLGTPASPHCPKTC